MEVILIIISVAEQISQAPPVRMQLKIQNNAKGSMKQISKDDAVIKAPKSDDIIQNDVIRLSA